MQEFIRKRIHTNDVPYFDPLPKVKLLTYSDHTAVKKLKLGDKEVSIKADRTFFCKLVVIAKA